MQLLRCEMVKAYLRYEHTKVWGLVSGPGEANVAYLSSSSLDDGDDDASSDRRDRFFACCAAGEFVNLLDVKTGKIEWSLRAASSSTGGEEEGKRRTRREVTSVAATDAGGGVVAAGFSDGSVRLWKTPLSSLLKSDEADEDEDASSYYSHSDVTFRGHRNAVTSIAFAEDGAMLASGGKDTEVVVWDCLEERGVFRLKGHKGEITSVTFAMSGEAAKRKYEEGRNRKKKDVPGAAFDDLVATNDVALVTTSKDGFAKVWDLVGRRCCQTLSGFGGECWASAYSEHVSILGGGCEERESLKATRRSLRLEILAIFASRTESSPSAYAAMLAPGWSAALSSSISCLTMSIIPCISARWPSMSAASAARSSAPMLPAVRITSSS